MVAVGWRLSTSPSSNCVPGKLNQVNVIVISPWSSPIRSEGISILCISGPANGCASVIRVVFTKASPWPKLAGRESTVVHHIVNLFQPWNAGCTLSATMFAQHVFKVLVVVLRAGAGVPALLATDTPLVAAAASAGGKVVSSESSSLHRQE